MDLSRLLEYFATKINTTLGEEDVFLKKYQKKSNSVFTEKDFELLKKDLHAFAEIDFNTKDISEAELIQLFNSKIEEKYREYSVSQFMSKLEEDMQKAGIEPYDEPKATKNVSSLQSQPVPVDETLTPEELALKEKYSKQFNLNLSPYEVKDIAKLDEQGKKRLDELYAQLPQDEDSKFEMGDRYLASYLTMLVRDADDEQFKIIKDILSKGLPPFDLMGVALQDNNIDKLNMLNELTDHLSQGKSSEEATQFIYENGYEFTESLLDDKSAQNMKAILSHCKDNITPENISCINKICQDSSSENISKAVQLISLQQGNVQDTYEIISIANLDDDEFEEAKELLQNPEYKNIDIPSLLKAKPEMRDRIKDFADIHNGALGIVEYQMLTSMNEKDFTALENIAGLKLYDEPVSAELEIRLSKCPKEAIEKIKQIAASGVKISPEVLAFMAEANDNTLYNFVTEHPDYTYKVDNMKNTMDITIPKEGDNSPFPQPVSTGHIIRYNQNSRQFDIIGNDVEEHGYEKQVTNTNQTRSQTVEYKRIASGFGDRKDIVTNQKIDIYDDNGKKIKTEIYEQGALDGVPNITEIDANGNKKILQKSTIDAQGNIKVEKDFTSVDGTRTRFQSLEDDNGNRRSFYKITDKDGNVLLDRVQTFTVLGENKFQSSLNGKSWDIEYKEDNTVSVKDNQTGKITTIPLGDKIAPEDRNTMLNIFKNLSGEQLMIMDKNNINSIIWGGDDRFSNSWLNNAYWNTAEEKIYFGGNTISTTQEEFLQKNISTLFHEYGHFIDASSADENGNQVSGSEKLKKIFEEEFAGFKQIATTEEEIFIDYFTGTVQGDLRGAEERFAETNMLLHTNPCDLTATRAYYLQRYFPRTVAAIAEEITGMEEKARL